MPAELTPRGESADRLALAWSVVAAALLLLSLLNHWLLFGVLVWVMLLLGMLIGFGPRGRRKSVLIALSCFFLLYTGLLLGIYWTYRPDAPLVLFFGLPLPTAFLIYGIWPLAAILGLLYGIEFRRVVLPEDKLERFLSEFGKK